MLDFQNPTAFLFLLLIPLLYLLRYFKIFKQVTFSAVLADWNGKAFAWNGHIRKLLSIIAKVVMFAGFVIAIAVLADPVITRQEKVYTSLGADIVFAIDTSPSMAAKDIGGMSRLDSAKSTIRNVAVEHDGCRFGIVVFGNEASVFVPPTADLISFAKRIDDIQVGMLGNGSAIGDGLSTAVCHLVSSSAQKKAIILFTDGENNAGQIHPETAAALAADNNISIYVVGIGTKGTVPIEYVDPLTGKLYSGYLDSNFNSTSLRRITSLANGRYFEVTSLEEFSRMFEAVARSENVIQNYTYRTVTQSLYRKVLLYAIILFAVGWFLKRIVLREMMSFRYKKSLIVRSMFIAASFIMLLLAHADIHWGTYLVPVQKSGAAVSLVYDISNSMLAEDCEGGLTRLKAACEYTKALLSKMEGVSVSVVLAKGDGVAAIPITDDYMMIESLLDVMSPRLMTVPGSSIGKGILKAKETFPTNYSNAGRIWVFTDGEETDNHLKSALSECIKAGIPVSIIGFGSETESPVLAGDGQTLVNSALRSQTIISTIEDAKKNLGFYKNQTDVIFINSTEKGSAVRLLNQLKESELLPVAYEAKPVPRFKLFLLLAVLFFSFSYIFTEFDFSRIKAVAKFTATASCILLVLTFTGCSDSTSDILKGTFAFAKKQYSQAVAYFNSANETAHQKENEQAIQYALYDLGTAYSLLGEDEAAMEKYSELAEDAPDTIRYGAYYNAGIIAHKNEDYEHAIEYFKKALEADSTRVDAKINLELSIQSVEVNVQHNQSNAVPSTEDNTADNHDMEKAVFERIKENDQKQWKNSESNQSQSLADDY
ncbi:MAG: VWA domain-containing protein [Treponema sp.]|nr:VWA domain-containing protein [Treponema sp.]